MAVAESSVMLFSYSTKQRRAEAISLNLYKDKPEIKPVMKMWSSLKLMNSSESTSAVEELTAAPSYYAIAADKGGLVCPSSVTAMYLNRVPDEDEDITSVSAASFDCMRKIFDGQANPFGGIGIKLSNNSIADAQLLNGYIKDMLKKQSPTIKALIKCLTATVGYHAVAQTISQFVPSSQAVRPPVYIQTSASFQLPHRFLKNRHLTEDFKSRVMRAHHRLGLPPPQFERDERQEGRGYMTEDYRNKYSRR